MKKLKGRALCPAFFVLVIVVRVGLNENIKIYWGSFRGLCPLISICVRVKGRPVFSSRAVVPADVRRRASTIRQAAVSVPLSVGRCIAISAAFGTFGAQKYMYLCSKVNLHSAMKMLITYTLLCATKNLHRNLRRRNM